MRLKVKFSGVLPSLLKLPTSELTVEAASGSTLRDVMRSLDVSEGKGLLCAVNGRVCPSEFRPQDGDEITVIPPVAGG